MIIPTGKRFDIYLLERRNETDLFATSLDSSRGAGCSSFFGVIVVVLPKSSSPSPIVLPHLSCWVSNQIPQ